MKKAIRIMVLLSRIFSILLTITYATLALVSFIRTGFVPAEQVANLVGDGIKNLFLCSFAIGAIVITYTKGEDFLNDTATKTDAILAIVFGAIGCPFLTACGIIYLVWMNVRKEETVPQIENERKQDGE